MARGVRYQSPRHAAEVLGLARATIKRYCNDPNNTNFIWLKNESATWSYTPIFGKKDDSPSLLFENYQECIETGFATNKQNAYRKIRRKEPGWRYAHIDNRGSYTLQPG